MGQLIQQRKIQFFCLTDGVQFSEMADCLICPKCSRKIIKKNNVYNFIDKKTGNSEIWNNIFENGIDKVGILKRIFDRLLLKFLPDLLNDYIISYVLNQYSENAKLIELGCGEATVSRSLLQKKNYAITLLDFSDVGLRKAVNYLKKEGKIERVTFIKDDLNSKK